MKIADVFGDTRVNAFGDTHINAFGETYKRIWCLTHISEVHGVRLG